MAAKTETQKTAETKVKAPAKTPAQRVTELLKAAALKGKINSEELDAIGELANSLKVFLKA